MSRASTRSNSRSSSRSTAKSSKAKSTEAPAPSSPHTTLREFADWHEYERRLNRPMMMKMPELKKDEQLRHVIFAEQFDTLLLDRLCQLTTKMREIGESREGMGFLRSLLSHRRAMLYFTQASTRTFLSFMAACQILGMPTAEIRDPSVSSEAKGESPFDSIRMFSSYYDVIIMRARYPDFAEACAYLMNDMDHHADIDHYGQHGVPIINGGSGADEHPTQALLDIYTLQSIFSFRSRKDSSKYSRFNQLRKKYRNLNRGLNNKVYCFCGDIGRGRTVRSLAKLLSLYDNVTMYFVFPPHEKLALSADLESFLLDAGVTVYQEHRLRDVIDKIDVLYMTRIQHEHDHGDNYNKKDMKECQLSTDLVAQMKDYAAILHPFPRDGRNPEIPFEIDPDSRARYFEQSYNGMWARAALLSHLFHMDSEIYHYYEKKFSGHHDYNEGVL